MCEHCGCRDVESIADLMDEHLAMQEIAGRVRRAISVGARQDAIEGLARLADLLGPHVREEEAGIFAALRAQGDFADHVDELEREHGELDGALAALDPDAPDWADRVEGLLRDLDDHIAKENLGTFPVAVVTLGVEGWDVVAAAQSRRRSLAVPAG